VLCFFIVAQSFSRYHPSKGYWWQFKDGAESGKLHIVCGVHNQLVLIPYVQIKLFKHLSVC